MTPRLLLGLGLLTGVSAAWPQSVVKPPPPPLPSAIRNALHAAPSSRPLFLIAKAAATNAPVAPPPLLRSVLKTNTASGDVLRPGVYQTIPYSCLVLVPGPHVDDKSLIGGKGEASIRMPIKKPDLKFIPWPPARQQTAPAK